MSFNACSETSTDHFREDRAADSLHLSKRHTAAIRETKICHQSTLYTNFPKNTGKQMC